MHLKHAPHIHSPATEQPNTMTSNTITSRSLFDAALVAKSKADFRATKLSVPDELRWFNDNTSWDTLSRKEFREIMIRMETITVQFYNDFGGRCTSTSRCTYPGRHTAIKQFWADEWGCEYVPETNEWLDLATGSVIRSETEKKAEKDENKALKKERRALKKAENKKKQSQYNDEEEEVYVQAAQKQQPPQTYRSRFDAEEEAYEKAYAVAQSAQSQSEKAQSEAQTQKAQKTLEDQVRLLNHQQHQQLCDYDAWYDAEEEAHAEAYAKAHAQAALEREQKEAQAYLDSFTYLEEEEEEEEEPIQAPTTRVSCQAVLYIEELTNIKGDPDWRAYIYYDERIRRYVLKGTRRSVRATSKKTAYPEVKLCFRSSHELASYLRSSADSDLNVTMYAMSSATVKDATFAELYALPVYGYKTELFGYDETCPRFSTFVNYLRMIRDIDVTHSTFASF